LTPSTCSLAIWSDSGYTIARASRAAARLDQLAPARPDVHDLDVETCVPGVLEQRSQSQPAREVDPAEPVEVNGDPRRLGVVGDEPQEGVLEDALRAEEEHSSRPHVQRLPLSPARDLEAELAPEMDRDREQNADDHGALDVRGEPEREPECRDGDAELWLRVAPEPEQRQRPHQTDDGADHDPSQHRLRQRGERGREGQEGEHREPRDRSAPARARAGEAVEPAAREGSADGEPARDCGGHVRGSLADELAVGVPPPPLEGREVTRDRRRLDEADERDDPARKEKRWQLAPRQVERERRQLPRH
jgi:hypothetical protein